MKTKGIVVRSWDYVFYAKAGVVPNKYETPNDLVGRFILYTEAKYKGMYSKITKTLGINAAAVDYAYNLGVRCVAIFCPDKKIIYTSEMRYLRKMYAAGSFGIIYYRLGVKKWVQYKVKEGIRLGFVRYSDGKIGNILQNLNQPPDKGEEMNEQALQLSMFGNE